MSCGVGFFFFFFFGPTSRSILYSSQELDGSINTTAGRRRLQTIDRPPSSSISPTRRIKARDSFSSFSFLFWYITKRCDQYFGPICVREKKLCGEAGIWQSGISSDLFLVLRSGSGAHTSPHQFQRRGFKKSLFNLMGPLNRTGGYQCSSDTFSRF